VARRRNRKDLQGSRHDPQTNSNLTAVRAQWNSGLCYLGGIAGAGEYLEYHTEVWKQGSDSRFRCPRKRVIGPPSRGKLLLSLSGL
jgi:hypothetical protein